MPKARALRENREDARACRVRAVARSTLSAAGVLSAVLVMLLRMKCAHVHAEHCCMGDRAQAIEGCTRGTRAPGSRTGYATLYFRLYSARARDQRMYVHVAKW